MLAMTCLRITIATMTLVLSGACSKKAAAVKQPTPSAPAASVAAAPPPEPEKTATSPNLDISDAVAKGCQLRISSRFEAPRFEYDNADLQPQDREVLEQIATCLTKGPLRGKQVQLIGRADPRGTEEYNLALGSRRAESVSAFLARLGVPTAQLALSTRGAIDATGTEESGWQQDRRVDLELRP